MASDKKLPDDTATWTKCSNLLLPVDEDASDHSLKLRKTLSIVTDVPMDVIDIIDDYGVIGDCDVLHHDFRINYFQYLASRNEDNTNHPIGGLLFALFRRENYHDDDEIPLSKEEHQALDVVRDEIINKYSSVNEYIDRMKSLLWIGHLDDDHVIFVFPILRQTLTTFWQKKTTPSVLTTPMDMTDDNMT